MSKALRDTFNDGIITPQIVRDFTRLPGAPRDKDGKILYVTEQGPKDECDVNNIIRKYAMTGVIEHVAQLDAQYGDLTATSYKEMIDKVMSLKEKFLEFPSALRNRFGNDPAKLLDFLDDPRNKEEAMKLGIIRSDWNFDQKARDTANAAKADAKDSIGE